MDESVQGSKSKDEKLGVNSENTEYSTNWCDIPMEMRIECIKRMNFRTRTRLGATSHTEKSLVEVKKFHFDCVRLAKSSNVFIIHAKNKSSFGNVRLRTDNNHEKTLNCLVQILKNCEIDTIEFSKMEEPNKPPNFWSEIEKCAPFRFKTFKSDGNASTGALMFLKLCEGVENILLNNDFLGGNCKLSDFIHLPAIINAKLVRFKHFDKSDRGFHKLVQKWIDNQSEIGKSLQVSTFFSKFAKSFASEFKDRVIYKKKNEVRIQTNEESKHILMRCDEKGIYWYCSCIIIPSNLLESEYEKDDQWIDQIIDEDKDESDEYQYSTDSENEYESFEDDDDGYDDFDDHGTDGSDSPPNPEGEQDRASFW